MENLPLIVFAHLDWDFVYQRPQHLLSRLARRRRVLFIEEPRHSSAGEPCWKTSTPAAGVRVCRPYTPLPARTFAGAQLPLLTTMLRDLLAQEQIGEHYAVWCYTAMACPLARTLHPRLVIYDCMDELAAFQGAPPELLEHEKDLLGWADVVFTGGPSLYRAKKDRHHNVHCFASSVDGTHFARALDPATQEPAEQQPLPHPRLGFYGVLDERLDVPLVAALAQGRPDWQIILVGPVVKIAESALPRQPNLHYFGQRSYADLPRFLAGWDVCLLPFARNAATRFISPTKTLEYMAAQKPIVSTPITDVAEPYGQIVHLGGTPEEFLAACARALAVPPAEWARRREAMRQVLARTSWDATVQAMEQVIAQAGATRPVLPPARRPAAPAVPARPIRTPVAVIGAGPTGLSATYHLGADALCFEQNPRVGGWCRSLTDHGFTFDFAGHIMFSNDPYVHEMYRKLLGDNVHWQDREAWIYSKGVYTRYPFQGALYGLPPAVIKECLTGAIEARFGSLKARPATPADGPAGHGAAAPHPAQPVRTVHAPPPGSGTGQIPGNGQARVGPCALSGSPDIKDCCGDGVAEATAPLGAPAADVPVPPAAPRNFEEFIYKVWGAGIARHFAIPYNRKIWAVELTEMETSWLGGRVPLPDLEEMIEGALSPVPRPMGPNARFGYPLRGGFQALMDGFLPYLQAQLRLNTSIAAVHPADHQLVLSDGQSVHYDVLISTMPLPVLIGSMGPAVPPAVRAAAAALRYTSVRCVNIGVGREHLTDKHWIYYPEETVFHRIFVQGNASPHCNPPGGFGLTCEITYSPHKPLPCTGQALIDRCISDCIAVGFFHARDPIWCANQVDLPHAYVVYDHARPKHVATIRSWLATQDIILAGRYSEWEYYNSDHAFLAGRKAAQTARQLQQEHQAAARTRVSRTRRAAQDTWGGAWAEDNGAPRSAARAVR